MPFYFKFFNAIYKKFNEILKKVFFFINDMKKNDDYDIGMSKRLELRSEIRERQVESLMGERRVMLMVLEMMDRMEDME